jgi:hypothetical protein
VNARANPIAATEARFAIVEHEVSYLLTPLNWRLQIWGQGVGGYAPAVASISRYADKARAEAAAQIWMSDGIYPAQQDNNRRTFGSQDNGG